MKVGSSGGIQNRQTDGQTDTQKKRTTFLSLASSFFYSNKIKDESVNSSLFPKKKLDKKISSHFFSRYFFIGSMTNS